MERTQLVEARLKKHWSQEEAAEAIGIDHNTLYRWEAGKATPRGYNLRKLCEIYGVTATDLGFDQKAKANSDRNNAAEPGFLDQEPSHHHDFQKETPAVASTSQESPPVQPRTSIDVDRHQSIRLFIPNSTPHVVTIHFHQPAPVTTSTYSESHDIIDVRNTFEQEYPGETDMGQDGKLSRRETVGLLAGLPFLNLVKLSNLLHDEEFLSVCAVNIPIYWRFYFDGYLEEVGNELRGCLPQLSVLASLLSPYQKWAASLASKAHQLASMMELQPQNFGLALMDVDQAIQYARCAEDPNLLAASLIRKALIFFYLKRSELRLETYNEAYLYADNVSPLLKGRICMGLAEVYSSLVHEGKLEHEYTALRFLELMHNVFPSDPKEDQNFAYTHFKLPDGYEGLVYLNLDQPGKAWDAFIRMEKVIPKKIVPDRVELSILQALASVALGDLDQSRTYLMVARDSSIALGSRLRYHQSCDAYGELLKKWPGEQRVRELADLFVK